MTQPEHETALHAASAPAPPSQMRLMPVSAHGARTLGAGLLVYTTNHLISHVPSRLLRHAWYRRVVGVELARGADMHLGTQLWLYGPGHMRRTTVSIGTGTRINADVILDCRGGIEIGDHVSISPQVAIVTADHDHHAADFALRHRRVVIEDHVWIGMRATILPGVRIGRGAVVAAGAVVIRDVEPRSIVAGVPARRIAERNPDSIAYELSEPPAPFA